MSDMILNTFDKKSSFHFLSIRKGFCCRYHVLYRAATKPTTFYTQLITGYTLCREKVKKGTVDLFVVPSPSNILTDILH